MINFWHFSISMKICGQLSELVGQISRQTSKEDLILHGMGKTHQKWLSIMPTLHQWLLNRVQLRQTGIKVTQLVLPTIFIISQIIFWNLLIHSCPRLRKGVVESWCPSFLKIRRIFRKCNSSKKGWIISQKIHRWLTSRIWNWKTRIKVNANP